MTPEEQITLMKIIETREACQNQDPTPKDLKVIGLQLRFMSLYFTHIVSEIMKLICWSKCLLYSIVFDVQFFAKF